MAGAEELAALLPSSPPETTSRYQARTLAQLTRPFPYSTIILRGRLPVSGAICQQHESSVHAHLCLRSGRARTLLLLMRNIFAVRSTSSPWSFFFCYEAAVTFLE